MDTFMTRADEPARRVGLEPGTDSTKVLSRSPTMRWNPVLIVGAMLFAGSSFTSDAEAFSLAGVGGRLGYVDPEGLDGTVHYGVHAEFERPGSSFHVMPSALAWTARGNTSLNANLDAYRHFTTHSLSTPYLGLGVGAFQRRVDTETSNTDFGVNVFGGFRFPSNESQYYIEARYAATDHAQLSVLGGATFRWPH
jgi:hypothetical protein